MDYHDVIKTMSQAKPAPQGIDTITVATTNGHKIWPYAFTISLSIYKKFPCHPRKIWDNYSESDQEDILIAAIQEAISDLDLDPHYVFELTKKGNKHVHGWFYSDECNMLLFQHRIEKALGVPANTKNPHNQITCYIEKTEYHQRNWLMYCAKRQNLPTDEELNTNWFLSK